MNRPGHFRGQELWLWGTQKEGRKGFSGGGDTCPVERVCFGDLSGGEDDGDCKGEFGGRTNRLQKDRDIVGGPGSEDNGAGVGIYGGGETGSMGPRRTGHAPRLRGLDCVLAVPAGTVLLGTRTPCSHRFQNLEPSHCLPECCLEQVRRGHGVCGRPAASHSSFTFISFPGGLTLARGRCLLTLLQLPCGEVPIKWKVLPTVRRSAACNLRAPARA